MTSVKDQRTMPFRKNLNIEQNFYPKLLLQGVYIQAVFLCCIHVVSMVTLPPNFNSTPDTVKAYVGNTAVLPCSVSNLGSQNVIWKKKDRDHALTVGDFVFIRDKRISVEHVPYKDEWNLVIKNVQMENAGFYECQISTKEVMAKYVHLKVIDSSMIKDQSGKKDIFIIGPKFVERGHPIRLTCNVTGRIQPPGKIDWFQNGLKLKSDARNSIFITRFITSSSALYSELVIHHSHLSDTGVYICRSSPETLVTKHELQVMNSQSNNNKRGTVESNSVSIHSKARTSSSSTGCGASLQISSVLISCLFVIINRLFHSFIQ